MTQPEADKLLITPDDTMEEINGRCYELLRAALAEATRYTRPVKPAQLHCHQQEHGEST